MTDANATNTTKDRDTGLPLLGASTPASKSIPIDPALMPELREKEEEMLQSDALGRDVGLALVMTLGTAAGVGIQAAQNRKDWSDFVKKIAAMYGVPAEAIKETDLEKALLVLK